MMMKRENQLVEKDACNVHHILGKFKPDFTRLVKFSSINFSQIISTLFSLLLKVYFLCSISFERSQAFSSDGLKPSDRRRGVETS